MEPADERKREKDGHPVQIIDIQMMPNHPSRMNLQSNIRHILKDIGDKNVALISIAGPSRQGKSFLLSYMIKYLSALEKKTSSKWIKKSNNAKKLEGFPFQNGIERHTTGLWLWSRPFMIRNHRDEEIAVLVMDTQGVFDDHTTSREWSAIVGLSLLCSSCLIYNVVHNLQEDVLQILENFMQYGILAMKDDESGDKCFQNLTFLIRDWNMPDECDYGPLGGQEFLNHKLKIQDHLPEASKRVRQTLRKCFDELNCFLMPDPGDEAKSNGFTGSIGELDKRFVRSLTSFMESVLGPDQIKAKRVGGQLMKGKNILQLFERYVDIFNSDEMPSSVSMLDATSHAVCETMASKCKDGFQTRFLEKLKISGFLNDAEFKTLAERLTKEFLIEFDKKKKFGDAKIARKHKRRLEGDLNKLTEKIREKNTKLKYEKSNHEQDTILSEFKSKISQLMENNFILHDDLDAVFKDDTEKMLTAFCQKFDNNKMILEEMVPIFNSKIQELISQFHAENDEKISNAKTEGKSIVNNCFATYENEISLRLIQTPNTVLNNELILTVDNILRRNALTTFDQTFKIRNEKLIQQLRSELESLMNGKLEEIALNNSRKKDDQISRIEELLKNIVELYEADISNALAQELSPDARFLQNQHFIVSQKYCDVFMSQSGIQELTVLAPFLQKLKSNLNDSLENAKIKLAEFQNRLRGGAEEQIEQIRDDYQKQAREIINDVKVYSLQELNGFHQNILREAESKLQVPDFLNSHEKLELRNRLTDELNQEFESLSIGHQNKLDDANYATKNLIADALLDYTAQMENIIENLATESELEDHHNKFSRKIEEDFARQISFLPSEIGEQFKRNLADELDNAYGSMQEKFALMKRDIEQQVEIFYNEAINNYNDEINAKQLTVQQEDLLSQWHELFRKQHVDYFTQKVKSLKFDAEYMVPKLENQITKIFQDILRKSTATLKENIANISSLLEEALNMYRDKMNELLDSETCDNDLKFQREENALKKSSINYFQQYSVGIPPQVFTDKKEELKIRIDNEYQIFLDTFKRRQCEGDAIMEKSISESVALYKKQMDDFLKGNSAIKLANLDDQHGKFTSSILQNLPPKYSSTISKTIKSQMESAYATYKERVTSEIEVARKTEELNKKLKNDIAKEMKDLSETSNDIGALKPLEETLNTLLNQELKNNIADQTKKEELVLELKKHLEQERKKAETVIKSKEPDSIALKLAKQDAILTYEEEMNRHLGNSDFIHPKVLENHHRQASKVALRKIASDTTINMTPRASKELTTLFETAFSKYQDKNKMNMPVKPAIGIDLGTTFSCVAVYHAGKVTIIPNENSRNTTPSYVAFKDGIEMIGEPAKDQAHMNPENTIFDAKRLIGRKFDDPIVQNDIKQWPFKVINHKGVPKIQVNDKTYHPEEISAKVLKKMKEIAERYLQCKVENAVITVPAYFNDGQKQATRDAGRVAGLNILGVLNEPTAAAVAYSLNYACNESRNVLIFDFGGGTFDVAVLSIQDGKITAKAVDGDTHLGGEDFDSNMVNYCVEEFKKSTKIDLLADRTSENLRNRSDANRRIRRLRNECERQKINLSGALSVTVALDAIHGQHDLAIEIKRETFEKINKELLDKSIVIVERALKSANLSKDNVGDIVLVGGSTRIPKVQELLTNFFNGRALNTTINPDEAVAYGAAIHAAILNGDNAEKLKKISLTDVAPLSIGIEVFGGNISVIIPKNTTIPVKKVKDYTTVYDDQKSVNIEIYEGEETVAKENHLLGKFELDGIPKGKKGSQSIEVTMEVDKNGILNVNAVCKGSGLSKNLSIIQDKGRLTAEEIETLQGKV